MKTDSDGITLGKRSAKRICVQCKREFTPHRIDQTCCSTACRAKHPRKTYQKYDAVAAKKKRDELKALAVRPAVAVRKFTQAEIKAEFARRGTFTPRPESIGLDGVSEFQQARREARAT